MLPNSASWGNDLLSARRQAGQVVISLHNAHPVDRLAGVDRFDVAVLGEQQVQRLTRDLETPTNL